MTELRYTAHLAVLHPSEPQVLALREADGLHLPSVHPPESLHGGLEEAALTAFDIRIRTMKAVSHSRNGDDRSALCVAEWLGSGGSSSDSTWIKVEDMDRLQLAEPAHSAVLKSLLSSPAQPGVHAISPGWIRKAWLPQVESWLSEQLGSFDLDFYRTWSISSVARVQTQRERYYFKAVAPHFHLEPKLTAYLAHRFPGQLPEIVTIDEERGWLLLREFGGEALNGSDVSRWAEAIQEFASMQIACLPYVEEMIGLGFPDRRLENLAHDLPRMLSEDELALGLEDEEVRELRRLRPRLAEWCLELALLGPPPTLVHGDLHPNNINVTADGFVFFDWTDASISHPFVDLIPFHMWNADAEPGRVQQINGSYLEPWRELLPAATIDQAVKLSKLVGLLYHARSYFFLVLGIEEDVRWQMDRALPALLKRVIEEAQSLEAEAAG